MCGIAALYEPASPPWLVETARTMMHLVRHRGPDGEGLLVFAAAQSPGVAVRTADTPTVIVTASEPPTGATLILGHRRLAILDLSPGGHQPMSDAAAEISLTFNGEIYNYLELRAELTERGHAFHTGTDTEVILAAWREWGAACLPRFNGMFAFVLYDRRTRQVFAARDRFGVKPLYLWRTPTGGVALASEIKQFTAHPHWQARLNGQRAYDFLNWGVCDHTAETLFAEVQQVRGGEFLCAPLAELPQAPVRSWYRLQGTPFPGDFTAAADRLRELLDDSVRLRLRADVPVGSCLSGGLDSSAIVATLRAQLGAQAATQQQTFTSYSDVPRFDERSFAEEVARAAGVTSHHVTPQPEGLLAELPALAWHQDEPFGSTSIYAQWCVFQLARRHGVTVMLDGQGADEAMAGYHGYFAPRQAGLLRRGQWMQAWREAQAIRARHGQSWKLQTQLLADEFLPRVVKNGLRRLAGRTVSTPAFLDLQRLQARRSFPLEHPADARDPVRALSHAQLTALNLPMLLHWEDRNSMAHGIEARLPFLDYRLVEFCLGLPESYKLSFGHTKRVLREGMNHRLPDRVRLRSDKLGFATAEENWMRGPHRQAFLAHLDEAIETSRGIFTPALRTRATRMLAGEEPFHFVLWRCISFGVWLRRFSVKTTS